MQQQNLSSATTRLPQLWQSAYVRRLGEADRAQVLEHLLALPARERKVRFGLEAGDEWVRAWVDCLDFEREAVIGVGLHQVLIGLAHVDAAGNAGVSVLAPWRGKGIAHALLTAAWAMVWNRGVSASIQ